jgi:hypothetical protein
MSGSIWVGPGVRDNVVGTGVGTVVARVSTVGVGVTGGVVCMHPAVMSRNSSMRRPEKTDRAFMHRRCPRKI